MHLTEMKNGIPKDVALFGRAKGMLAELPTNMSERALPVHFDALKGL